MGNIIRGSLGALAIHLAGLAVSFGFVWLWTNDFGDASQEVTVLEDGSTASVSEVLADLDSAFSAVVMDWMIPVFIIGLICALLFLIRSAGAQAAHAPERAALKPFWTVLLFVDLVLAVFLCWLKIISSDAAFAMSSGNSTMLLILSTVLLLLAYFLSTALLVKTLMVPSVPLAPLIRGQ